MGRAKWLFILGLVVMALPHLGFVGLVEKAISFGIGLLVVVSAYSYYIERHKSAEPRIQPVEAPVKKSATPPTRTRAPRKIPSPYLPPLVKETPPAQTDGFVFIKRKDKALHE